MDHFEEIATQMVTWLANRLLKKVVLITDSQMSYVILHTRNMVRELQDDVHGNLRWGEVDSSK